MNPETSELVSRDLVDREDGPSTPDVNALVGGLLRDLAFAQASPQKTFGFKRAAAAVLGLDRPLSEYLRPDGTLDRISGIGPASTRVILEALRTGGSATVERAIAASDRASDILRRRTLRSRVLSRAAVLRILHDPASGTIEPYDYRGDLQMHSEWSDGIPTLADIVAACVDRGYSYAAVTDHSHGLKIAGGMTMEQFAAQHEAIDRLNAAVGTSFRLLKGVEANIRADGSLDLSAAESERFEIVLAAPHAKLRVPFDQTERLIHAVRHPHVHVLAHPRGRIAGSRAGIVADWRAVFAAAAQAGVAIEIDGDPARQDLDYQLAGQALDAGCLFALDSDAHTVSQLGYAETAIAHARLASIPCDRIVNTWPLERLAAWLGDRRSVGADDR